MSESSSPQKGSEKSCEECGGPDGHEVGEVILCPECYQRRGACCGGE